MPGIGAGLPVDQKTIPVFGSIAGEYQTPAPLFTAGFPQKPSSTVWKLQIIFPVSWSNPNV